MGQKIFDVNPVELSFLLESIRQKTLALPDFQRDFVWDPRATEELVESVCRNFPAGSILRMKSGVGLTFAPRCFEGAPELAGQEPTHLILDGQQRLTSLYQALYGVGLHRYFIDLRGLMDGKDLEDCVSFLKKKDWDRKYGTLDSQARHLIFPLSQLFAGEDGFEGWLDRALELRPERDQAAKDLKQAIRDERKRWISTIESYEFPVVTLSEATTAEAVCTIFETLNRTGVKLTVFELLAARFWADEVKLRNLWDAALVDYPVLEDFEVDPFYVLQAIAIHEAKGAPSCKRSDVLALGVAQIRNGWSPVVKGLAEALEMLRNDCGVVVPRWLPYGAMLIPLAAVIAGSTAKGPAVGAMRQKLRRWFWCAALGQVYDNPPNSQAVKDFREIRTWLAGGDEPEAISQFKFDTAVLRQTTPKQKALYRGVIALILRHGSRDFHGDQPITAKIIHEQQIDDHHIFPQGWLRDRAAKVPDSLRDSVLNRTLIDKVTNIRIGKNAPSTYLGAIEREMGPAHIASILRSHLASDDKGGPLWTDDFEKFIDDREARLRKEIEQLTG